MFPFDDEDDIFSGGSPRKKFGEIIKIANQNIVQDELDTLIDRLVVAEIMLEEKAGIEDVRDDIPIFRVERSKELEERRNSIYIESVANIVSKNE